jgi:murein DD-endopeptidase MepM/ murein hydrolase activator NlpD
VADAAGQIDGFLTKRGSPMAGLGHIFVAAGQKYGVDPKLVASISGIESSFGKHIFGNFNAWGWGPGRSFGSWQEGITTVTRGLREGYLSRGLRTPQQIVSRYAPASDGNDEQNWANTVSHFMGQMGGGVPTTTVKPKPTTQRRQTSITRPNVAPPPDAAELDLSGIALQTLAKIARGEKVRPTDMLNDISFSLFEQRQLQEQADLYDQQKQGTQRAKATPEPIPKTGTAGASVSLKNWKAGWPIVGGTRGGHHETSGLPGFPAYDYFAKPGAPVVAPVGGTIERFSGHDPAQGAVQGAGGPLGWSLYLRGTDGRTYYLTHMGSRSVKVGQAVQAGQLIGTVADYDSYGRASHIHMGIR